MRRQWRVRRHRAAGERDRDRSRRCGRRRFLVRGGVGRPARRPRGHCRVRMQRGGRDGEMSAALRIEGRRRARRGREHCERHDVAEECDHCIRPPARGPTGQGHDPFSRVTRRRGGHTAPTWGYERPTGIEPASSAWKARQSGLSRTLTNDNGWSTAWTELGRNPVVHSVRAIFAR